MNVHVSVGYCESTCCRSPLPDIGFPHTLHVYVFLGLVSPVAFLRLHSVVRATGLVVSTSTVTSSVSAVSTSTVTCKSAEVEAVTGRDGAVWDGPGRDGGRAGAGLDGPDNVEADE